MIRTLYCFSQEYTKLRVRSGCLISHLASAFRPTPGMALWFALLSVLRGPYSANSAVKFWHFSAKSLEPQRSRRMPRRSQRKLLANRVTYWLPQSGIAAPEVTVSRGLPVNRPPQVQRFDDPARRELEVSANQIRDDFRIHLRSPKRLDQHTDRIGPADRLRQLHFAAPCQPARDHILRNVPRHISRRPVHLRRIFSAECPAAVPSHPAVGVYNNLASSQPGVAHGPTNHKPSRRIDVILRILVEQLRRNHCLNHMLQNPRAQFVVGDSLRVLRRNHDGIHPQHLLLRIIFNCNL